MISQKNTFLSTVYLQAFFIKHKVFFILITSLLVFSCSSPSTKAPISSRSQPPNTKALHHIVAPGETLYSIAWRYGLDYKGLAKVNKISGLYQIFPRQVLLLEDKPRLTKTSQSDNKPPSKQRVIPPAKVVVYDKPKNKVSVSPSPVIKKSPATLEQPRPEKKSSSKTVVINKPLESGAIYWVWPAKGRVITNFHLNKGIKKGIDIQGKKGDSVISAAAGKVVYAGSGIRGYGKLIIIKHDATYLSAYAHNSNIRVKEGDFVKSGQHIADIGATGVGVNGKPKLHFQVRRDGKPIDPLPLLPKRKS